MPGRDCCALWELLSWEPGEGRCSGLTGRSWPVPVCLTRLWAALPTPNCPRVGPCPRRKSLTPCCEAEAHGAERGTERGSGSSAPPSPLGRHDPSSLSPTALGGTAGPSATRHAGQQGRGVSAPGQGAGAKSCAGLCSLRPARPTPSLARAWLGLALLPRHPGGPTPLPYLVC